MDTKRLRLFLTVLEHGSFSKAAEHANMAQPALGAHIRKLEEELGLQLLDRHSRGIRATEAGEMLARKSRDVLAEMDRIRQEMIDYAHEPSGQITVGLSPKARDTVAVALIERVAHNFPGVKLAIKEAFSSTVLEYLSEAKADMGLVYNTQDDNHQIVLEPLAVESMYFIYPLSQGRRAGETITLANVMKQPLILPTRPHMVRTEVDRLAAKLGLDPNVVHEVDSVPAIRELVRKGLGCSVVKRQVEPGAHAESIGCQLVVQPEIKRLLYLAYPRRHASSKAFDAVVGALRAIVDLEKHRDDGQWRSLESSVVH